MPRPATSPLQSPSVSTESDPRASSPIPMTLRHRGPTRSATFAEGSSNLRNERRNSTLSDSVSEARNSIRSSTDVLLFPRAPKQTDVDLPNDESHWHSAPLGLALLPAIAGVFFQNGSAVVTDVTLLVLAAIFLNWSVRLPWDWYRSAQAVRQPDRFYDASEISPVSDLNEPSTTPKSHESLATPDSKKASRPSDATGAACRELQIYELAALVSCFLFPIVGTWLLHTIRSKLSRPSEGLVSNYNLTIFLLAAEIRPFSHLLKMVQARTLHLQRIVSLASEEDKLDISKIIDLTKRLEDLEAHVSETAAERLASESSSQSQDNTSSVISQATTEVRKGFQPEIDALTRAVRRYEKRTANTNFQTESRLQALENQINQAISLITAVHRTDRQRRNGLIPMLFDWIYAAALFPIQIFVSLTSLPWQGARWCLQTCKGLLNLRHPERTMKGKTPYDRISRSPRQTRRYIPQDPAGPKGLKSIRENSL
ncbi:uncharacterized protein KD926_007825 [Aspergillus affinis]|uniref:uncharacterized protein n=1 Tax=Aspergillus affinis TaxID=1070780 RepID=UPI0022FE3105|nr:uncharacterized protein KD926_007825 [Aspergillus affinis]KAI9040609.1 hypothetical protein KD926_007825 [Aspergillus affinis]